MTGAHPHPLDTYVASRRRRERQYGKAALAREAGVSRHAVYRIIWGSRSVSPHILLKIEAATGISAVALFAAWKATRDRLKANAT